MQKKNSKCFKGSYRTSQEKIEATKSQLFFTGRTYFKYNVRLALQSPHL